VIATETKHTTVNIRKELYDKMVKEGLVTHHNISRTVNNAVEFYMGHGGNFAYMRWLLDELAAQQRGEKPCHDIQALGQHPDTVRTGGL
jgi:hypothetical protein